MLITMSISETANMIAYPKLNKAQVKMHSVYGHAIVLKSSFEKRSLGNF